MNYLDSIIQRLDLYAKGASLMYTAGGVSFLLSLLLKTRMTWREWYLTFGVVGYLAWMGNIIFFFLLDLLDSGDPSIGGLPDLFLFAIAPSSIAILYLNFLQSYDKKVEKYALSFAFVLVSLFFEFMLVKVGFLIQKGWKVWYSIPFYFLFYSVFLPWHLHFMRGGTNKLLRNYSLFAHNSERLRSLLIRKVRAK